MFRWVRRALIVVALVVLVGGGLIALTSRPDLKNSRDDVDARWVVLRPALDSRYALLAEANDAVRSAGGPEREIVTGIDTALREWRDDKRASVPTQVDDANALEALGRRLATSVTTSSRLNATREVTQPTNRFRGATVPVTANAFNRAVRDYEGARGGSLRRPIAALLGYRSIAAYDLPAGATA